MASPIRWFRKHSQVMMVVFGVLLMAAFGLGSVLSGLNPGDVARRGEATNEVVAEWTHGELKRSDLAEMRHRHFAALQLLNQLEQNAINQNDGKPVPVAAQRILPIIRPGDKPNSNDLDEQMMNRYLLAKRAEQEGLVVNETMVYEYIAQFAGDIPVTRNLLKQLNRQVNPNTQLTPVIRHLQIELLAQQMETLTRGGLPFDLDPNNPVSITAVNPTEAIQLYARTNRRIESQVLPLPVSDYVSKVDEVPTEAVLRQLYEQGKYEYPSFNFEDPGFKLLNQARVQYFIGELESFLQNEIAKLTDEEVQKEYDRLVAADDDLVMEIVAEEPESGSPDESSKPELEGIQNGDASGIDPPPAPGATGNDMTPAPETGQADSDSNDSDSEVSDSENSGSESSDPETPDTDTVDESGDDQVEKTNTVFRQEAGEAVDSTSDPIETDRQDEATPANGPDSPPGTDDSKAAAAEPAPGNENSADKQEDGEASDPVMEEEPKKNRRPKPLKDVVDDVKRQMKTEAARIARDKAMEQAEKELRKFQMMQSQWESRNQRNDKMEEPVIPDFRQIADDLKIEFLETGLIDQRKIGDERIGKVNTFEFINQQIAQSNVGEDIFNNFDATGIYEPTKVDDFATNSKLIYWMAEKVDQKVPSFEEARESVIEFWKHEQAVELAKQEALKIADEVNASGKLLKDVYLDKALDTGAFSWFSSFGQFAYGAPAGVENPGEEFMGLAFSLPDRKAGVALNEMRDIVYVIQPNTPNSMSLEQLGSDYLDRNFFLTRRLPPEVLSAKGVYQRRMNFEWFKEFLDSMEVNVVGQ